MRVVIAFVMLLRMFDLEAQVNDDRIQYSVSKINEPIEINGEVNEIGWQKATEVNLGFETFPK